MSQQNSNQQPPPVATGPSAGQIGGGQVTVGQTNERQVTPGGPSPFDTNRSLPSPQTVVAGGAVTRPVDKSEYLSEFDEVAQDPNEQGFGPKFVILHNYVMGHRRGEVVAVSLLLSNHEFDAETHEPVNPVQARLELRRLLDLGAVRKATAEESEHKMVTFVTGEEELAQAYSGESERRQAAESESQRLRKLIESVGADPNASPEEFAAQVKRSGAETQF